MGTAGMPSADRALREHSRPAVNSWRRFSVALATRVSSSGNSPVPGDPPKDSAHAADFGTISSITPGAPLPTITTIRPAGPLRTIDKAPESAASVLMTPGLEYRQG